MRSGVRHPTGLAGLALAARDEPVPAAVAAVGDAVTAVPELRRDAMINNVTQHVRTLTVFDQSEGIAAELEVVAPLIDTVGAMAFDVDTPLDVAKEFVH
jgi:hypothetical protein